MVVIHGWIPCPACGMKSCRMKGEVKVFVTHSKLEMTLITSSPHFLLMYIVLCLIYSIEFGQQTCLHTALHTQLSLYNIVFMAQTCICLLKLLRWASTAKENSSDKDKVTFPWPEVSLPAEAGSKIDCNGAGPPIVSAGVAQPSQELSRASCRLVCTFKLTSKQNSS